MHFSYRLVIKYELPILREKERKVWIKMSYCMIIYVSTELNESLPMIVLRHKNTGLRMCRINPVFIISLYLLTDTSQRSLEKVISLSFMSSF